MKNNNLSKSNLIGFILSVIFTVLPFYTIKYGFFTKKNLLFIAMFCAIGQIYVQLIYFLHLNHIYDHSWNIISLVFTIFIVFILILGSTWIMHHLHHNLMT